MTKRPRMVSFNLSTSEKESDATQATLSERFLEDHSHLMAQDHRQRGRGGQREDEDVDMNVILLLYNSSINKTLISSK